MLLSEGGTLRTSFILALLSVWSLDSYTQQHRLWNWLSSAVLAHLSVWTAEHCWNIGLCQFETMCWYYICSWEGKYESSVFCLIYRLQRHYESLHWLFVIALFLYKHVLNVLKGVGICENERVGWYIELERQCVSPGKWMQFIAASYTLSSWSHRTRYEKKRLCCIYLILQPINCSANN